MNTTTKLDLDELERKSRRDAERLDGLHGDPSRNGGWMSNPEPVDLAVITEISAEMTRWHEDDLASEQECMRCRNSVHTPSDLEPTPLCDLCAQFVADHVPDLVASIAKLTAERDSLRAHVEAQDVRIKGLETRINLILEKGVVLP